VLKPGGHLLAFGGTRTYHRLVVNIEDAGFEIRDQIMWIYGSGFPKSMNLHKASDGEIPEGQGTALKPANEPICLARKPLSEKTVAKNVLKHGVGGLNIEASRIGYQPGDTSSSLRPCRIRQDATDHKDSIFGSANDSYKNDTEGASLGRFPANILFDEAAAAVLDEQSGILKSGAWNGVTNKARSAQSKGAEAERVREDRAADSGGASRFFKVVEQDAEPEEAQDSCVYRSRKERKPQAAQESESNGASRFFYVAKASKKDRGEGNTHPTVKPVKLMEYLIKLVTPEGGIVLDPFMGSGTTGVAAKNLGFGFRGIEMTPEYFQICQARILSNDESAA
jgi:site-specific DNA-methyltransferase (adenine-specific)